MRPIFRINRILLQDLGIFFPLPLLSTIDLWADVCMSTGEYVGSYANCVSIFAVEAVVVGDYIAFYVVVVVNREGRECVIPWAWEGAERMEEEAVDSYGEKWQE